MSNLTIGKRDVRSGKRVTRAARAFTERASSVLFPSLSLRSTEYMSRHKEEHDALLAALRSRVRACCNLVLDTESHEAQAVIDDMDNKMHSASADARMVEAFRNEISRAIDRVSDLKERIHTIESSLDKLSLETIKVLLSSFDSDREEYPNEMLSILEIHDEVDKREAAQYRDVVRHGRWWGTPLGMFHSVKRELGIYDLSAVERGSEEYSYMRNVIDMAAHIKVLRYNEIQSASTSSTESYEMHTSSFHDVVMTPDFASIIADYPNKLEVLKQYFEERGTSSVSGDMTALKQYVESPSQALTQGVL